MKWFTVEPVPTPTIDALAQVLQRGLRGAPFLLVGDRCSPDASE